MKNISLILLIFILGGCASVVHQEEIFDEKKASKIASDMETNPENGLLVGSFSYYGLLPKGAGFRREFRYSKYKFEFQGIDSENSNIREDIGFESKFGKVHVESDFILDEGRGHVFAFALPEGEYEFFTYTFFQHLGFSYRRWTPENPFSIKFKIERGKATYIGEVRAIHEWGKKLGMVVEAGGHHIFIDSISRDNELLLKKYPFLSSLEFNYNPLNKNVDSNKASERNAEHAPRAQHPSS